MHSRQTGPEALTSQLRRRHEYTAGRPCLEEYQNSRSKRRDPVKELGEEAMEAAREQHQESVKRLVDHVWEDYQRIKARENEELETTETLSQVAQSAAYQRSRSNPCRGTSSAMPSTPRRDPTLSSRQGAPVSGYRGLRGLNDRYQEVRKTHALERRSARATPRRDGELEMTQRRNIDAMVNPRANNQRLGSQIRQLGRDPRAVQTCQYMTDSGFSEGDDTGYEDLREFERYVKAEAARLDAALKAVEDDLCLISKRKDRPRRTPQSMDRDRPRRPVLRPIEPSRLKLQAPQYMTSNRSHQPTPQYMSSSRPKQQAPQYMDSRRTKQQASRYKESSRSKQLVPQTMGLSRFSPEYASTRHCQCAPKQQSSQRACRGDDQSDSVMELHPFKSRTASGRPWTDAESKSTVQFFQCDEEEETTDVTTSTATSCSETSAPNAEDIETVEQLLMELESKHQPRRCPGPCSDESPLDNVAPPRNMKQIAQMVSREGRDVGLALQVARTLPPNKATMSGRCPKFRKSSDVINPFGDLEEMTPQIAAQMMETHERGISAVSPPHKMVTSLFPELATEPLYEVGSITTKNGLVVPLQGSQYSSPLSQQDIADLSMMSDAIRPDIVPSGQSTAVDSKELRMAERGSLADSVNITGWTALADSATAPGGLASFDESGEGALIYTLKPQPLATNVRLRGSAKPPWFPGYYMALPTDSRIKLASSASQVLIEAHDAVNPAIFDLPKKQVCRC